MDMRLEIQTKEHVFPVMSQIIIINIFFFKEILNLNY